MKELKDIVLQIGDIVYIDATDDTKYDVVDRCLEGKYATEVYKHVYKIERQIGYTTIYEAPKQILDKEEKEWLENFLKPLRGRVERISKICDVHEHIKISYYDDVADCYDYVMLPLFTKNTMYKGMELAKEYTLKELRLFEGEEI